jgi:hypothetical protein
MCKDILRRGLVLNCRHGDAFVGRYTVERVEVVGILVWKQALNQSVEGAISKAERLQTAIDPLLPGQRRLAFCSTIEAVAAGAIGIHANALRSAKLAAVAADGSASSESIGDPLPLGRLECGGGHDDGERWVRCMLLIVATTAGYGWP